MHFTHELPFVSVVRLCKLVGFVCLERELGYISFNFANGVTMTSYDSNEQNPQPTPSIWRLVRIPVYILAAILVVQLIVKPFFMFQVPAGYGAALTTGGDVHDEVYLAGPHFKMPWQSAAYMKLITAVLPQDTKPTDSNSQSLNATVVPQVWVEAKHIPILLRAYGSYQAMLKSVVEPQIGQATRGQTSHRTPEQLIWNRDELVSDIRDSLGAGIAQQLKARNIDKDAIQVGLVAVTQFGFSKAVRDTLENKAESQVRTHTANAKARIRGIVADKDARVTEITAEGDAEANKLLNEANAYRAKKLGEAAAASADVAQYEAIVKWVDKGGKSPRIQLAPGSQVIINGQPAK